jgi:hypothetical protein
LTLHAFWLPDAEQLALESLIDLKRLFPKRRKVRRLQTAGAPGQAVGFEGESPATATQPWWKRPFARTRWQRWRIWCVRHEEVHVIAQYRQADRSDQEARTLALMIVNALEFARQPPCPPAVFARKVLELARARFPLLDCQPAPDFQIRVGESKVNLFNFYRSYINAPEQFESIVLPALTTVVQVQEWGKEQTEPPLDAVSGRIMPMLYPEEIWSSRFANFVGLPWVGGLVILYVVDEHNAYWYIRDELRAQWGLEVDQLHELALANLNRYFQERPMEFTVAGEDEGPRVLIPARPDAYNTARLLSRQFHEGLRQLLGKEFAVGIPSRDFFVAVSLESGAAVDHVRQKVEDDFRQMDHPLSDKLLFVTRDGVTEYVPW